MNEAAFLVLGLLLGGILGWIMGAQQGVRRVRGQVVALLRAVRTGNLPSGAERFPGEIPAIGELRSILVKQMGADSSDAAVGGAALERLADYLQTRVAEPLAKGLDEGEGELRVWVESVLEAVEDMRFYLQTPASEGEPVTTNLVDLVGEVTQEFSGDITVRLKVEAPPGPLRVQIDPEPLKDALFLVLHNAGEFGGEGTVELTLRKTESDVHILIRDHGPGFTAEALSRGMDPFYSTSPNGLGLGLPYAKMALKAQGGEMALRNAEGGGAEVEMVLPQR